MDMSTINQLCLARWQCELKNRPKSHSRRPVLRSRTAEGGGNEAEVLFAPKSASSPRRLQFLNAPCARWFAITLAAFSLAAMAVSRAAERNDSLDNAFSLIREAVEKDDVPGAIALVARGGTILRHEAYGLSDIENQRPFTTNTLCWIASITKPVTVAAAMTLVDAGKLALDDPVEKYLPEFREQRDTNGAHYVFTIRQVM